MGRGSTFSYYQLFTPWLDSQYHISSSRKQASCRGMVKRQEDQESSGTCAIYHPEQLAGGVGGEVWFEGACARKQNGGEERGSKPNSTQLAIF